MESDREAGGFLGILNILRRQTMTVYRITASDNKNYNNCVFREDEDIVI